MIDTNPYEASKDKLTNMVVESLFVQMLDLYGRDAGISKEICGNGQIRYRQKVVANTPGIWISKAEAQRQLYLKAYDNLRFNINGLDKLIYESSPAAA